MIARVLSKYKKTDFWRVNFGALFLYRGAGQIHKPNNCSGLSHNIPQNPLYYGKKWRIN